MWESTVGDQELTFELVGLNNQNFIMRDQQTGTWWQQVTGEAIRGPLAGERLRLIASEISTFGLWASEHPGAQVLDFDEAFAEHYIDQAPPQNRGEEDMIPFHVDADPEDALERGALIVGLELESAHRAYPMELLLAQRTVIDRVAGRRVLLVVGDDDETVRAFDRTVDGRELEFYRKAGGDAGDLGALLLVDSETGTEWSFAGEALSGELAGKRLERIPLLTEYWFDWKSFHPETEVYSAGVL